mmetsp:Transcript_28740/g.67237  ORF Transcript_28740/g.67237 Transcript_28740/m.67237 type:complete len:206 (-) Transcript_28740:201-818(-)
MTVFHHSIWFTFSNVITTLLESSMVHKVFSSLTAWCKSPDMRGSLPLTPTRIVFFLMSMSRNLDLTPPFGSPSCSAEMTTCSSCSVWDHEYRSVTPPLLMGLAPLLSSSSSLSSSSFFSFFSSFFSPSSFSPSASSSFFFSSSSFFFSSAAFRAAARSAFSLANFAACSFFCASSFSLLRFAAAFSSSSSSSSVIPCFFLYSALR